MTAADVQTREFGRRLARLMGRPGMGPARAAERRAMAVLMAAPELRAALFRFVDVQPACRGDDDLAAHLVDLLEGSGPSRPSRVAGLLGRRRGSRVVLARTASAAVRQMAQRFIVGENPVASLPTLRRLWDQGVAASVDLLGEATVSEREADVYARRCREALEVLHAEVRRWPARPTLEEDSVGRLPRVNLSVKVSALTPLLRPHAPARGVRGAEGRLRELLRAAGELGAHLHVDMESLDSREAILDLTLGLLAEDEFAEGPSAGVVLQGYLNDSPEVLDRLLAWGDRHPRAVPLTVRLVKGAYWDHEVVHARQRGWRAPVFTDRRACDRNFEGLARRLLEAIPSVRVAIASHNLRSIAHAAAYGESIGLRAGDVEYQVLRGLGDDAQRAILATGRRVRCYCPVGDLVSGMAYLVRRLLENTSNQSFLSAHALGEDIDALLEAP